MKSLLFVPVLLALIAAPGNDAPAPRGDHDWVVDTGHSSAMFKVMHASASNFYGAFNVIEGTISLDPAAPENGRVELSIPVDSIDSRDAKRDAHLKGPDFFNGKENPDITFASTKIAANGDGTYEVTGDLALAGETQSVTAMVRRVGESHVMGHRVGYETSFEIQRSKFGMDYGLAKKALGDEVTILISLELTKPNK